MLLGLALVFGFLAVANLVFRIASAVRGTPIARVESVGAPLLTSSPDFAVRAGALAEVALSAGHQVEVLLDDVVYTRMLADMRAARASITVLGYYCDVGTLGDQLSEVLEERARAGVQVLFLGDDFGCGKLLEQIRGPLTAAGASVAAFRPVRWWAFDRAQHRMHARSVVIDGIIGYTGGFGIDDKWLLDKPDDPKWRDTSVRFTGPAVLQMQGTFLSAWAEATGDLLAGPTLLSVSADSVSGVVAGLLYSRPGIGPTPAERYLALTIASAERTLFFSNSYFVPTALLRESLMETARRGVDVRLLVPDEHTDIPVARYAGRGFYEELIRAGVRVFEYQPSMMHAKTVVADGRWVGVGSVNLDNRSIRLNDESALLVFDPQVGARMDSIFFADLKNSEEITLEEHERRPVLEKLLEVLTRVFAPLM